MMTSNIEAAVELVPIQDTYVVGVDRIEFLGKSNARIYLYTEESGQRIIVGKMVIAIDDIQQLLGAVIKATKARLSHVPMLEVEMAGCMGRH